MRLMKKGYTLIEILVVVGILAILSGLVFSMMGSGNLAWNAQNIKLELQQKARIAMEYMVEDLYQTTPNQLSLANGNTIVIFKVPVIVPPDTDIYDAGGDITWGALSNITYSIRYSRNAGNQLVRDVIDPSSAVMNTKICANNVTALQFSPQPLAPALARTVNITITCSRPLRVGATTNVTTDLQSQVTLRN